MRKYPMLLYFVGQNELISNSGEGHKILNVCIQSRIVYHNLSLEEEGRMHLWCTPYMSYILLRECKRCLIYSDVSAKGSELRSHRGAPEDCRIL